MIKKKSVSYDMEVYKKIMDLRGENTFSGYVNDRFREIFKIKKEG